jgi:hypothetical protein
MVIKRACLISYLAQPSTKIIQRKAHFSAEAGGEPFWVTKLCRNSQHFIQTYELDEPRAPTSKEIAQMTREAWGFLEGPINNLVSVIENTYMQMVRFGL